MDTLSFSVTDLGNAGAGEALHAEGQVLIEVLSVNDPPEIILDRNGEGVLPSGGALDTDEDTPLVLTMLSVNDVEMLTTGRGRLTISLRCATGGIGIASGEAAEDGEKATAKVVWAVGGLAEGAGPGPWQAVAFSGGLPEANQALSGLTYVPAPDWHGVDDIHVRLTIFVQPDI